MPTSSNRVRLVGWAKARPSKYSALANSHAPCPRARLSAWAKPVPGSDPGESHEISANLLLCLEKLILKVSPDSQGGHLGTLRRILCGGRRHAPARRRSRPDGDVVHCVAGSAVWCQILHGYRGIWPCERSPFVHGFGIEERYSEPRHLQPYLPHARPQVAGEGVPALHGGLCQIGRAHV